MAAISTGEILIEVLSEWPTEIVDIVHQYRGVYDESLPAQVRQGLESSSLRESIVQYVQLFSEQYAASLQMNLTAQRDAIVITTLPENGTQALVGWHDAHNAWREQQADTNVALMFTYRDRPAGTLTISNFSIGPMPTPTPPESSVEEID